MARIAHNILTKGFQGKIGELIFRKRGDKTTVYVSSPRKVPLSKKQVEAQLKFKEAVWMAREALKDENERKKYKKMAMNNKKESAYSAAISYFMSKK